MTHDEAERLLPDYALGVLENATELEAHLRDCPTCAADLADFLETTARLAEAVEPVAPPPSLRARVLAHTLPALEDRSDRLDPTQGRIIAARVPDSEAPNSSRRARPDAPIVFPRRVATRWLATAAAFILVIGAFAAGNLVQQQQLQATRAELALDRSGLDLLTSTETANARLAPVAPLGDDTHGHWFHRDGVPTQVLVVEAMPTAPAGEAYWGWLQQKNGAWIAAGRFTLDRTGYGRIILTGRDGSDVQRAEVTRQANETAAPTGTIVLRWP